MTTETLISRFIALVVIYYLIRVAIWIAWPRTIKRDPYDPPHGWEERP